MSEDKVRDENGGVDTPPQAKAALEITDTGDIHATRDEAVVEQLTKAKAEGSREEEEDDEIDSALAELRESESEDDDEDEDEDEGDDSRYFHKVIEGLNGKKSERFQKLQGLLNGAITLNVSDCSEGYTFSFRDNELSVEHWEKNPPNAGTCSIEVQERYLEQILRGRLNPQIAMLSHKVQVAGDAAQAVYFFNLFSRS
ncbi:MAG: SCP2 sterol-binding domain-containing protein [Bdellovibrionota bacterium]